MSRVALVVVILAWASATGAMQFQANTRLVQINVIVRDKKGPVADLTRDDFLISDRGKARAIGIFSENILTAAAAPAQPLPQDTFSNRPLNAAGATPAVTMILLDRLNTLIETSVSGAEETPLWNAGLALESAKQHVLKLIDQLSPNDRLAIYSLGESLTVLSDFSSDRERLKTILNNFHATSITSREVAEPDAVQICPLGSPCGINGATNRDRQALANLTNATRAQTTMAALSAIAAHVAAVPGRKNLVWLTANLPVSGEGVGRLLSRSNIAIYPVDARGLLPMNAARTEADVMSPTRAGSVIATVMGSTAAKPLQPPGAGAMQTLADETGGRAFINTNDLTGAIHSAINDGAVTYTLGFYVDGDSVDGKFHELRVRVRRAGLEVRTQKGYFALPDAAPENNPVSTLASPLESSAIHLLARVEHAGDALSISGSVDLRNLTLAHNAVGHSADSTTAEVEIHFVQQDAAGAVLDQRHENLHLRLTAAQVQAYLKTGVFFRTVIAQKEGWKTLRIVAIDRGSGATGSLIIPDSAIR